MIPFQGTVWRILFADRAHVPLSPARAPQGRFHHSGQTAIYTSLTQQGAGVAIKRYIGTDDAPRVIVPIQVKFDCVVDLRGRTEASIIWQDLVNADTPSPTWALSDAARNSGAQAMLYSSRSYPELSHIVLFDFARDHITVTDDPCAWPA